MFNSRVVPGTIGWRLCLFSHARNLSLFIFFSRYIWSCSCPGTGTVSGSVPLFVVTVLISSWISDKRSREKSHDDPTESIKGTHRHTRARSSTHTHHCKCVKGQLILSWCVIVCIEIWLEPQTKPTNSLRWECIRCYITAYETFSYFCFQPSLTLSVQ